MNIGEEEEQYVIEPLEEPVPQADPAPAPEREVEPDEVEVSV